MKKVKIIHQNKNLNLTINNINESAAVCHPKIRIKRY